MGGFTKYVINCCFKIIYRQLKLCFAKNFMRLICHSKIAGLSSLTLIYFDSLLFEEFFQSSEYVCEICHSSIPWRVYIVKHFLEKDNWNKLFYNWIRWKLWIMAINMISLIRKKQRILQDIFVELSAITVIVSISKLVCNFHRDSL